MKNHPDQNKTGFYHIRGNRGQYIYFTSYFFLPRFCGRKTLPSRCSKLSKNASSPKGLPVCVCWRNSSDIIHNYPLFRFAPFFGPGFFLVSSRPAMADMRSTKLSSPQRSACPFVQTKRIKCFLTAASQQSAQFGTRSSIGCTFTSTSSVPARCAMASLVLDSATTRAALVSPELLRLRNRWCFVSSVNHTTAEKDICFNIRLF